MGMGLSADKKGKEKEPNAETRRPLSNYNFDEAVLKVQEWNEALRCEPQSCGQLRALTLAT
jgi:hypothetical protein